MLAHQKQKYKGETVLSFLKANNKELTLLRGIGY